MFANKQADYVPTKHFLLDRPLEPDIAYAIDPDGTIEVDDAVSVYFEESRYGHEAAHLTTYIANTAILGNEQFEQVRAKAFSVYTGDEPEYMLPKEVIESLSLGGYGEEIGAPALAVRIRIHNGNIALTGIDKVRVRVNALSYSKFTKLVKNGDETANKIKRASYILQEMGYYSSNKRYINAHDIVASHMVITNIELARYAMRLGIPWIYRSHRGSGGRTGVNQRDHIAHYTHRNRLHRGIGETVYCHATSPLRRSPDHINQRIADAIIDGQEPPFDFDDVRELSIEANNKVRQWLGTQSVKAA